MKHRILFVDDEPNLLEGLKRMLRPMRQEWDMIFASGGQEALACLEHTPADVVVSDVRMPVINGIRLLTEVKQRYPHTVRILLSGQSDEEMIRSAVGLAHQYLAKPCDADVLKSTINRTCRLKNLLGNPQLQQLVSQVESLPTLPHLYQELLESLQQPDCSLERVAAVIGKDVGMTVQILKLVNSAFFGAQKHISNPIQAVLFLGLETVKTLVLSLQIFRQFEAKLAGDFTLDRFCRHSSAVGAYARKIMIAEKAEAQMVEESLTAGMLHDLGVLILSSYFPDRYQGTLMLAHEQKIPLHEAERHTLGTSHAEVGAYLLGLWGLTTPIVEAVAFHHDPMQSSHGQFSPLTAVHVANALVSAEGDGFLANGSTPQLSMEYLEQLGLAGRVAIWQKLFEVAV
jgi:HD-like signal output (HDOD) protein